MADAIVDKILGETQEQLAKLQTQYATLKEKLGETTYSRDQLLAQVSCKFKPVDRLIGELCFLHHEISVD